jgi:hypothetical protein
MASAGGGDRDGALVSINSATTHGKDTAIVDTDPGVTAAGDRTLLNRPFTVPIDMYTKGYSAPDGATQDCGIGVTPYRYANGAVTNLAVFQRTLSGLVKQDSAPLSVINGATPDQGTGSGAPNGYAGERTAGNSTILQ